MFANKVISYYEDFTMSVVDQMDDEQFKLYLELADEMFNHESCTGMSNHALLICRKN